MDSRAWALLESGSGNAAFNMALDEALLEAMPRLQVPLLRLYSWTESAASFGYFQRYIEVERLTRLRPLVRRPTGGGIVPHDADWTYSLIFPTGHAWYSLVAVESYSRAHLWLQAAFARLGVPTELAPQARKTETTQCFVGHDRFDLLWRGNKVAGAAQRRRRDGLLIQGSVQPPAASLERADWHEAMLHVHRERGVSWNQFVIDSQVQKRALELAAQKYSQLSYNQKR